MSECTNLIHSKFQHVLDIDSSEDIKADLDAFSFIVSFDPDPSPELKQSLRDFLYCFGTAASQINLPAVPVSNKTFDSDRKDKLFGSEFVRSNVSGDLLHQSEIQIIDSPVKICLHKSRQKFFKQALDRLGFPIDTINHTGLCFNKNSTSNVPCYGPIVESLLTEASLTKLPNSNQHKHIFHVGNIGTRIVISPSSTNCPVHKIFSSVESARQNGAHIECSQIDVAFNVPAPKTRLPRFSRHLHHNIQPVVYNNCQTDVWPLHDITYSQGSQKISPIEQVGTVRFRHGPSTANSILLNIDEIHKSTGSQRLRFPLLTRLYAATSSSDTSIDAMDIDEHAFSRHLTFDMKSVHSSKAYSNVSHFNTREKRHIPLDGIKTKKLSTETIINIQRLLRRLGDLLSNTFSYVSQNGASGRIEISVRPQIHSPYQRLLRTQGHIFDILSHVYIGLHDSLFGKNQVSLDLELTYQPVSVRCIQIMESIQQIVGFRAQKTFDQVYKSVDMHFWLKAMIYLMTTLIGLTHDKKIQPLQAWLEHCNIVGYTHDPLHLVHRITKSFSVLSDDVPSDVTTPDLYQTLRPTISAAIHESLDADEECHSEILNLLDPSHSADMVFFRLSMTNKLIIAQKLTSELIPKISELMNKDHNNEHRDTHEHTHAQFLVDHCDEALVEDHSSLWKSQQLYAHMYADMTNSRATRSLQLLHQDEDVVSPTSVAVCEIPRPTHPVLFLISKLCDIHRFLDIHCPLFFARLKEYLKTFYRARDENLHRRASQLESTYGSLWSFGMAMNINIPRATPKDHVIQLICSSVFFPCDGAQYCTSDPILDEIHEHLLTVYGEISSIELTSKRTTHKRYYRDADNTDIHIPILENLIQEYTLNSVAPVSERTTDPFDLFIPDRNLMKSHLKDLTEKVICNQFLKSNGSNDQNFHQASSFTDLQPHIGLESDEVPNPDIIFPVFSRMIQKPICVYHPCARKSYLHLFDVNTKKVITYSIDHCDWMLPMDCVLILKIPTEAECVYLEIKIPEYNHQIERVSPRTVFNDHPSRYCYAQHLNKHQYKQNKPRANRFLRVPVILHRLLTQENVMHPSFHLTRIDDFDPLGLYNYINEIGQFQIPMNSIMCETIIQSFQDHPLSNMFQSFLTFQDVLNYITVPDHQQHLDYFRVIIPFLCLKHKLWICVWTALPNNQKFSHYYWFDPISQKVELITTHRLTIHKEHKHFLYLSISSDHQKHIRSTSFYEMPSDNVYNNKISSPFKYDAQRQLKCRLSYVDESTIKFVLYTFSKEFHMETLFFEDEVPSSLPANLNKLSIVVPVPPIEGVTSSQFSLIVVYPLPEVGYLSFLIHRNLNGDAQKQLMSTVMREVLHGRIDLQVQCHPFDINSLLGGENEPLCSGYYVIFLIYLTYLTTNHQTFHKTLLDLSSVDHICDRIKFWTESVVKDKRNFYISSLPEWLLNIYMKIPGHL